MMTVFQDGISFKVRFDASVDDMLKDVSAIDVREELDL